MLPNLLLLAQLWLLAASSGEEGAAGAPPQCSPGEDPATCEASAADVLLQKGRATKHGGAERHPPLEPPGTVIWDGYDKFTLARHEMSGFVAEAYYKVPRHYFGQKNSTHVFVEFNRMIKAIFVRDFHGIGSYEYGMATWVWDTNPVSVVAMNVSVGIGEKLHTFAHEGAWSQMSLNRVRKIQRDRWPIEDNIAEASMIARSAAVTAWNFFGQVGINLVNASRDPGVFADTEEAAVGPSGHFEQQMHAAEARLARKHAAHLGSLGGQLPTSSSTALNCFHFSDALGIQKTPTGVWMPLDKLIPATRGQIVLAPIQRFDLMSGNSMIKYNAADDTYGVYMAANQHSNVVDPYITSGALRHQPKHFVGPADGRHRPIPPDGRHQIRELNFAEKASIWSLHQVWYNTHADYKFLWASPSASCGAAKFNQVSRQIEENRMMPGMSLDLLQITGVLTMVINAMSCSIDYLRSDIPDSHSFGPFESFGYLHAMVEFPKVILMRGWNDIDEGLFCPARGCGVTTTTTTTTAAPWWNFWR